MVVRFYNKTYAKGRMFMNMKGNLTAADPITDLGKVEEIKEMLRDRPRDYGLFVVGINTGFRASDLVSFTVGQFRKVKVGGKLVVKEKKTGKKRVITVNRAVYDAVQPLLDAPDRKPLFRNRDGGKLAVESVIRLVKSWCAKVGLSGNFSSHTLRKTWGYHQRVQFGVDIPTLMEAFGHASQRQTLTYLCIQPEEIENAYMNEI